MRTIEKPDLRALQNKYSNWEVGEIINLIKTVQRLNDEITEDCNKVYDVFNSEKYQDNEKVTISNIHNDATQKTTFEIGTLLNVIQSRLRKFEEVDGDLYGIEEYIKQELPQIA